MSTYTVYEIVGNSDQTEGRGRPVVRERWSTLERASQRIAEPSCMREYGVQGVQGVELQATTFTTDEVGRVVTSSETLWGYRRTPDGGYGYGWLDNRDAPVSDPEYQEWLRLSAKFGTEKAS